MTRVTIAGVMALAVSAGCSTKNADPTAEPRQKVEEADKLYAAGNKSEAIALYKQYIDRSGRTREEAYGRIVDFEFSQGNEAEAKSWAKRAVDQMDSSRRLQVTVVSDSDLRAQKGAKRSAKQ